MATVIPGIPRPRKVSLPGKQGSKIRVDAHIGGKSPMLSILLHVISHSDSL